MTVVIDRSVTTLRDRQAMSPVKRRYFERVSAAEHALYGDTRPAECPENAIRLDLAAMERPAQAGAAVSHAAHDAFGRTEGIVLYGCSYVHGSLLEMFAERRAISVHMGIAPFYRGNAANFWAAYDGHPALIGATAHFVGAAADAGPVLFHSRPYMDGSGGFEHFSHAMAAVTCVFADLGNVLQNAAPAVLEPFDVTDWPVLRDTGPAVFTDAVVERFLSRPRPLVKSGFDNFRLPDVEECLRRTRVSSETQRVSSETQRDTA